MIPSLFWLAGYVKPTAPTEVSCQGQALPSNPIEQIVQRLNSKLIVSDMDSDLRLQSKYRSY